MPGLGCAPFADNNAVGPAIWIGNVGPSSVDDIVPDATLVEDMSWVVGYEFFNDGLAAEAGRIPWSLDALVFHWRRRYSRNQA